MHYPSHIPDYDRGATEREVVAARRKARLTGAERVPDPILAALEYGPMTSGQIAHAVGAENPLQRMRVLDQLDRLVREGLVTTESPEDGRRMFMLAEKR